MTNRLKLIRTMANHSAKYVADYLEIDEATYLYLEEENASVKDEYLEKLSSLYDIDKAFLAGKEYIRLRPFSIWRKSEKEDYMNASTEEKEYLDYKFGRLAFPEETEKEVNLPSDIMANEIKRIFEELTDERKIALFNTAKGLLKEMKELGELK